MNKYRVFDLHCDTADKLIKGKNLISNNAHIDLLRANEFDCYVQCFSCFTKEESGATALFKKKKTALLTEINKNGSLIALAKSGQELKQNTENKKMSAILTLEGTAGINHNPGALENLRQTGFRMCSLCWNEQNVLTGSNQTGGGLTQKGKDFVKEANRLGMFIDVSHISDCGFWDIIKISRLPVIASHSNSRFVHPHKRNITNDMFLAICQTGGVVGINLYTDFLSKNGSIDDIVRHIFHFLELAGNADHIALGGDLDGCDNLANGIANITDYKKIANALNKAGLDQNTINKILFNNAYKLFT